MGCSDSTGDFPGMLLTVTCLLLSLVPKSIGIHFMDVTNEVFQDTHQCLISAFGDFNSDKITDTFCLSADQKTVEILIGHQSIPLLRTAKISCSVEKDETINSVMPGDFNGDSMMDLLITVSTKDKNQVRIFYGNLNTLNCTDDNILQLKHNPLLLDYNGDMIPDLFADVENNTQYFWVNQKNSTFMPIEVSNTDKLRPRHSSGFLDLNLDMESDLLVTNENNIKYYVKEGDNFNYSQTFSYPGDYKYLGQSTFVDLDGNGDIEEILPACVNENCLNCTVLVRSLNSSVWIVLISNTVQQGNKTLCFKDYKINNKLILPATLRSSDFDMDGMPDFLTVVENNGKSLMILMQNVQCEKCAFGRTLQILWDAAEGLENVRLAAFYDLYEDGIMDILLTVEQNSKLKLHALQNKFTTDAYFIKVLVVGGLCYDRCPRNHHPYGTNQPGPLVTYRTIDPNGKARRGASVQLPQSAYFPLLLPYSVFGLSQTPNFVDEVEITIPGGRNQIRKRQLTQIIPNSQIVVIPYPPDTPKYWVAKLFVTPSHLVLMTFAALVGTCLFICLIIALLHWKERRQDKRERLLEAHRFHFDAM